MEIQSSVKKRRTCEITQDKNLKKVKVKELGKVYPLLQTYSHLPWDTAELFALSVLSLPIKQRLQSQFQTLGPS